MQTILLIGSMFVLQMLVVSQVFATEQVELESNLFFIAGTPEKHTTLRYPTILYSVDKKAMSLKRLRPITTQEQGSTFIRIYHDDRLVLIGNTSQQGFFQLDVIDMDNVKRQQNQEIRLCESCMYTQSYHLKNQPKLMHMAQNVQLVNKKVELSLYGLDYADGTNMMLDSSSFQFIKTHGASSGNYDGDHINSLYVYDNKPVYSGALKIDLGWTFPEVYQPTDGESFGQSVNNDSIRVFTPFKPIKKSKSGTQQYTHYVFDKKRQKWSSFTLDNSTWLRAYDQWIVTEQQYLGFNQQTLLNQLRKNRQEQKIGITPYRHYLERFKSWDIRKTGLLHLINPIKNTFIEIKTNKPDSEIILVENDQVFYRVEDQVFSADIADDKVINTQLLLKHPMVPAIHWAFMGKE